MNAQQIAQLNSLVEQLATELVFAEPGKDNGLLPINCLLSDMEQLISDSHPPEPLALAVKAGRAWIDRVFEGAGYFDEPALQRLRDWVSWLQGTVAALNGGKEVSAVPAAWSGSATAPEKTPAASPVKGAVPAASAPATEPVLVLNIESDGELLREFSNESQEHLQNIERGVLVLEESPTDASTLNDIFRAFHTFKGGSGFLHLTAIQTLAHELESLLDLARQHKLEITSDVINVILEGGDTLKQFISEIDLRLDGKKLSEPIIVPTLQLLERIRAVLEGRTASAPAPKPAAAPAASVAPVADVPSAPVTASAPASAASSVPLAAKVNPSAKESGSAARGGGSGAAVKVDTSKLDGLVDLVGELVIAQSLVTQNKALSEVQDQQLIRDMAQLGRITKELQRNAMSLRMVPIRSTFQKMNRLVRDIAAKIGKQVDFVTDGEETELDRTIIEEIGDPLVHMIRNSIDHGIERPEVRLERGKPAHGTVSLRAFYQGGNIVIEIKDDGNGLNRERILSKAVEKGLVRADAQMSDSDIYALIFAPGFSTADKVTDLSGRGVGMDVVRQNIEKLRGKVEIQSTPGQGSTFSIFLPLTLAIIEGLIVGVGGQRYILPTLSVCESFRPAPNMIKTVHGRGEMLNVRGKLQPVLRLYEHLGVPPASTDPTQSIAVVVEAGKDARCLIVDQLLGKQEVVIKSLGETFKRNPILAGAAILGDGRVGLILDADALVHIEANEIARTA